MAIIIDAQHTTLTFANYPSIGIQIKTITPIGASAGGAINTTHMGNVRNRTKRAKTLREFTDCSLTAAYDPNDKEDLLDMVGEEQEMTAHYPDGETEEFWAFVDEVTFSEHSEGEQPTAEFTIIPMGCDDDGVETNPAVAAATTTT